MPPGVCGRTGDDAGLGHPEQQHCTGTSFTRRRLQNDEERGIRWLGPVRPNPVPTSLARTVFLLIGDEGYSLRGLLSKGGLETWPKPANFHFNARTSAADLWLPIVLAPRGSDCRLAVAAEGNDDLKARQRTWDTHTHLHTARHPLSYRAHGRSGRKRGAWVCADRLESFADADNLAPGSCIFASTS
ncbi:hypothetical protein VDGL01_06615 [Verticillium dahliae]